MLKSISPILSPSLLKVLCEMGHGDEIVIADGGFPSESIAKGNIIVRADGVGTKEMLEAILPLFPLDQYDSQNFILMDIVHGDNVNPVIWNDYEKIVRKFEPDVKAIKIERNVFYDRAKKAYAVIATSETAQYANIILKKGVCYIG